MKRLLLPIFAGAASLAQTQAGPAEAGPAIIAEAFGKLSAALAEAIAQGGASKALAVCQEKAPAIAAEVSKAHGVTLRRATGKPRNPRHAADETEKTILASFEEALKKKEPAKPQTVIHPDGRVSYFAPIVLTNPLCLQCHGTPGGDISAATMAALKARYPEDKATGYKSGDLRGLWRVTFPAPR